MKLKQLSVFIENQPGQLTHPCRILAEAGMNIIGLSLADTEQFGVLRFIVREWDTAKELLERAGCVVKVTEMVAVEVADRPGGLLDILEILESSGINVEYMYALGNTSESAVAFAFRFEDAEAAIRCLQSKGINTNAIPGLFTNRR